MNGNDERRGHAPAFHVNVRIGSATRRVVFLQQVDDADGADVGLGDIGVVMGDGFDVVAGDGNGHLRAVLLVNK